ncbi:MAG TPA: LamG-like jellyroll fold domain-containing protein [Solirubrobacterales bacterium]|nr:LamG-like jellyroll fold domain-containing protein [Solirubrobacterales bacterium]
MAELLLDYRLDSTSTSNPDGDFPALFTGASVVSGPGETPLGSFPKALSLGSAGKAAVDLSGLDPDFRRFCIRIVFRAAAPPSGRQTLLASNLLPFEIRLSKESNSGDFNLTGSVASRAHGRRGADTRFKQTLKAGTWYTADLVYDTDTALLFIDGEGVGVYALPDGALGRPGGSELFIGTELDGASEHFGGSLAALQWWSGIPTEIESLLNEQRTSPEWFITRKRESVRDTVDLGDRTGVLTPLGDASLQPYQRGAIMYHPSAGGAFEMHGPIHRLYVSGELDAELGYLVSDELDAAQDGGRKSIFSKGGIYWSEATGPIPVSGGIYLAYEMLGEASWIGFPVGRAQKLPEGSEQEFESARMYHKDAEPMGFAVKGEILERFLATGGVGTWGYPKTNELPIRRNVETIGRLTHFEFASFYWSGATGAHEVHGGILDEYRKQGGPAGRLGFPTSDEADIPGGGTLARYNTFENGSILWFGSLPIVVSPFRVFLGRIDTKEEEGAGQGQNDVYFRVNLKEGNTTLHSERWPATGAVQEQNIVEPKLTLPPVVNPNTPGRSLTLEVDVWDEDGGLGGDKDHLGTWTKTLNMANGWGFRESNGLFDSGAVAKINSIKGSVKRVVDPATLSETQKWWRVRNQDTETLSVAKYAKAFRDVDSESEFWDLTDWVQKVFYQLVIRGLAENGNCFGMCLEAIFARKDISIFGQPLDQYGTWAEVGEEFNVKHQYQMGASTVWWFLDEVISGNTGDPKETFRRSRASFEAGDDPVICITRNVDFSGSPHVLLPVAWDEDSDPWTITILDPYFPGQTRTLTVDPDSNRFSYSGTRDYEGGPWTQGRFYFIPYSLLNERPRTPVWEAVLLILAGTVVVLGGDGQTESISNLRSGSDLDAFGAEALEKLKEGESIEGSFVSIKGLAADRDADRPVAGELLLRRGTSGSPPDFVHKVSGKHDGELLYALKQGLSEIELRSSMLEGEKTTVSVSAFGGSAGQISLGCERDKSVTLVLKNKLGVDRDYISLELGEIPVSAGEELQLNPKPGLAGLELVGQLAESETVVSVTGLIDGKSIDQRFTVPLGEGISLAPSTVVTEDALSIASIAELFGAAIGGQLIKAM